MLDSDDKTLAKAVFCNSGADKSDGKTIALFSIPTDFRADSTASSISFLVLPLIVGPNAILSQTLR